MGCLTFPDLPGGDGLPGLVTVGATEPVPDGADDDADDPLEPALLVGGLVDGDADVEPGALAEVPEPEVPEAGAELLGWLEPVGAGDGPAGRCLGAGARKMSWAGCCNRDGSEPVAAAAAVPPTTMASAAPTPMSFGANRTRRRREGAGAAAANRKCPNASSRPANS